MPLIVSPTWIPIGSVYHLVPQMEDDNSSGSSNNEYDDSDSADSGVLHLKRAKKHITNHSMPSDVSSGNCFHNILPQRQ